MPIGSQWKELWDRAKALESRAANRKREACTEILARFPSLPQKNFGSLALARRRGKLSPEVAPLVEKFDTEISAIIDEAKSCRDESERLLEAARKADTRRALNPSVDTIPSGPYPKLRDCKIYPLRHDCNYGETAMSRWDRCEYMEYGSGKSIRDPSRWTCTAPK